MSSITDLKNGDSTVEPSVLEHEHASKKTVLDHSGAIWEKRETYGPTGRVQPQRHLP